MSTKKEHKVKVILQEAIVELGAAQEKRLAEIEAFVQSELVKINDRNKAINGYVLGQVKNQMDNQLYNMILTVDALKELLTEANVIGDIETKISDKRKAIHEARELEAQEQMKANMEPAAEETPTAVEPSAVSEQVAVEQPVV